MNAESSVVGAAGGSWVAIARLEIVEVDAVDVGRRLEGSKRINIIETKAKAIG